MPPPTGATDAGGGRVLTEVDGPATNATFTGDRWRGVSPRGLRIQRYVGELGEWTTAYPTWPQEEKRMTDTVTARLFRNERGSPHAEVPEPWHFLGSYLRGDIQGNVDWTRTLRQLVEDYRTGRATEEWDGTGNAWTLIFTPGSDEALLELAVETGRDIWGTVPLEVLDRLLAGWERMLVTGESQLVAFGAYEPGPNTGA